MQTLNAFKLAGATLTLALFATGAEASFSLYTNKANFQDAAGALTTETFATSATSTTASTFSGSYNGFTMNSVANGSTQGITDHGVASSGDDTPMPVSFNGQNYFGWGNRTGSPGATATLTIDTPATAFGFDWFNTDVTDDYTVFINGTAATFASALSFTSSGFFGVIASGADLIGMARIQSRSTGGYISDAGIDNVLVSAPARVGIAAVPEPETLSLFGIALAGMMVVSIKRKRA